MKRILLITALVGLFAGQASAALYTPDVAYFLTLDDVAATDAHNAGLNSPTTNPALYGGYLGMMQGAVGFYGNLEDGADGDNFASVKWGDPGANLALDLSSYTGYELFIANDNQSQWDVALHLTAGGVEYNTTAAYTTVLPSGSTVLLLDFAAASIPGTDWDDVSDIGFYVRGQMSGASGYPTNPDGYHVSVVPVPAAVLLGLLGLSAAGLKLRRFA